MLKYKILSWLFYFKAATCNCHTEINKWGFQKGKPHYTIGKIGKMPKVVNESSGLAYDNNNLWTLNDSGGKNVIYKIDKKGTLQDSIVIQNAINQDWEELAIDKNQNVFVGDFGNNNNTRRNLTIYKTSLLGKSNVEKINFHYGDQSSFPPVESQKNYDCEAMFAFNDSLYLFSKNRGDKNVKLYALPQQAGDFVLFPTASTFIKTQVTAAAINPSNTEFALLTYGKIYFFAIKNKQINFNSPTFCLKTKRKQTEAITYLSDNEILFGNEQGDIYEVKKR
ncbi:MAG: hypothetical protein KA313_10895 [Pseudarcicella sp.]|nr:hypothetical protein [Pseudarcicella sp.]MBP6411597.1 hypothetical protein [Pseudarcicella sp.]